jgi:hypothetical protein
MADIPVVVVPLLFQVFVKTSDGEWTLKAAFATENLAGSWMLGLMTQKVEAKIFEDRQGELEEITHQALRNASRAIREASERK